MAGTAGSGGLGALAIGGIATAAVVIGGVVMVQLGVFNSDPPVDQVEPTTQATPMVAEPDKVIVAEDAAPREPANTNAQVGDVSQADSGTASAETSEPTAETVVV